MCLQRRALLDSCAPREQQSSMARLYKSMAWQLNYASAYRLGEHPSARRKAAENALGIDAERGVGSAMNGF
jgi:hypothetical protein